MKRLALLLAVLVPLPLLAPAGQRDDQWKKVNESISKGLATSHIRELVGLLL